MTSTTTTSIATIVAAIVHIICALVVRVGLGGKRLAMRRRRLPLVLNARSVAKEHYGPYDSHHNAANI
jgi:hypothetical protein